MMSLSSTLTDAVAPAGRDVDALARRAGSVGATAPLPGGTFSDALSRQQPAAGTAGGGQRPSLHDAADQLVATAFILPLLEQARQDPFKSDLFHGGRGEEVFGQQLDVIFADRITASANFGISDAIDKQFRQASPPLPAAAAASSLASASAPTSNNGIDLRG